MYKYFQFNLLIPPLDEIFTLGPPKTSPLKIHRRKNHLRKFTIENSLLKIHRRKKITVENSLLKIHRRKNSLSKIHHRKKFTIENSPSKIHHRKFTVENSPSKIHRRKFTVENSSSKIHHQKFTVKKFHPHKNIFLPLVQRHSHSWRIIIFDPHFCRIRLSIDGEQILLRVIFFGRVRFPMTRSQRNSSFSLNSNSYVIASVQKKREFIKAFPCIFYFITSLLMKYKMFGLKMCSGSLR
jgi:hypothetical protein